MAATLNSTTLSAAVTKEQKVIPLASVSTIEDGYLLVVAGEAMKVTDVIGTTAVEVIRGYAGTHARSMATAEVVYTGPENYFAKKVPTGVGSAATVEALPVIVLAGGSARIFALSDTVWVEAATSAAASASQSYTQRFRKTIAEVNAGVTLLPAIVGRRYRMIDAWGMSIGGAAAAVTTVDIIGTLSSARKLVAFAQASLTQSTLLRAGASGAAILADGASFTASDANTAITLGKTGSSITTATHIDVEITYALD